jgi:hypothetical protein
MTLEQVGQIIGVTKERVRQIQNKAMEKIRVELESNFLGTRGLRAPCQHGPGQRRDEVAQWLVRQLDRQLAWPRIDAWALLSLARTRVCRPGAFVEREGWQRVGVQMNRDHHSEHHAVVVFDPDVIKQEELLSHAPPHPRMCSTRGGTDGRRSTRLMTG